MDVLFDCWLWNKLPFEDNKDSSTWPLNQTSFRVLVNCISRLRLLEGARDLTREVPRQSNQTTTTVSSDSLKQSLFWHSLLQILGCKNLCFDPTSNRNKRLILFNSGALRLDRRTAGNWLPGGFWSCRPPCVLRSVQNVLAHANESFAPHFRWTYSAQ